MLAKLAQAKKAVAAASGIVAMLVSQGVLSGTAEQVVTAVLALVTAGLTYVLRNAEAPAVEEGLDGL